MVVKIHPIITIRFVLITLFGGCFALGLLGTALAQTQAPHVLLLKVDGLINPVKEQKLTNQTC